MAGDIANVTNRATGLELPRDGETNSQILLTPVAGIGGWRMGPRIWLASTKAAATVCVHENYYRSRIDCGFGHSVPSDAIDGTKLS
jgi:hypothetical protein